MKISFDNKVEGEVVETDEEKTMRYLERVITDPDKVFDLFHQEAKRNNFIDNMNDITRAHLHTFLYDLKWTVAEISSDLNSKRGKKK